MSERFTGCMLCGLDRTIAKYERCIDDLRRLVSSVVMVSGHEDATHIWTELVRPPKELYGRGLLQDLDALQDTIKKI